ncbi:MULTISPECIES: cbb3-type cytochrome c oxidase N-terminal domain-containing protein [unclassified Leeuwenhoekiella]|uniref:cbb3-type cytochrome c oxidase N-terminal domain-containing protein n=1 Tax=unclassified Leeuwenhoekiella TaxID=2615029 RepID=UPI000C4CB96B|nr:MULTISPECIES: cbb3-type cytochrome c oxidase N-terminal domain-containing protein [unclassified Leeuwenhoekiella]MAW96888.1 cytochrome C oxidase subunit III [Leeuwenhoekiella sp.]MBA80592.1 cytochrome C oxidase subunit III [Leeuwenhoekiella sp.]|tara:strand:- start:65395 stop:66378 length:984 start_codon:yes stop_codon:yes gene_type:complete
MRSIASLLRILLFAGFAYLFLNYVGTPEDEASVFTSQNWLWAIYAVLVFMYIAFEICIESLRAVLFKTLKPEAQEKYKAEVAAKKERRLAWIKGLYSKLTRAKAIEQEGEILLDHNYDGIKELDNRLPPWWVYGFYATILIAAIYLLRFEVFKDYNQIDEYEQAVAQAKIDLEEYKKTAKDLVDANTVELLTDATDIKAGEAIFTGNCIACHKAGGAGGIGPNLTDDYWILGGGIKNVFHTISEGGRAGKGMISWKTDLKPSEIAQVASYVLSLHGSNPADAKEPEGEIYIDENAPVDDAQVKQDSTGVEVILETEPVTGDILTDEN